MHRNGFGVARHRRHSLSVGIFWSIVQTFLVTAEVFQATFKACLLYRPGFSCHNVQVVARASRTAVYTGWSSLSASFAVSLFKLPSDRCISRQMLTIRCFFRLLSTI